VALFVGLDPLTYLNADEIERPVLIEVVRQALKIQADEKKREVSNIGASVGQVIAKLFKGKK